MENKFLWLCAFIDVLETLYVGIYKIGSSPLIFLHSHFWGLDVFSLSWIFFIKFEPFLKICDTEAECVSQSNGTFLKSTDALQPKGSMADSAAGSCPALPSCLWSLDHSHTTAWQLMQAPLHTSQVQMHSMWELVLYMRSNLNKARSLLWAFFFFLFKWFFNVF